MTVNFSRENILQVAGDMWQNHQQHKIWAFFGEMGAGKTTFIHALCDVLQVKDAVSSPTFAIVNEYKSGMAGSIYHMDWYRLKDEEEAIQAGIEDCLLSGHLCLVEWPGKAPGLLPDDTLRIYLSLVDENTRSMYTETGDAQSSER